MTREELEKWLEEEIYCHGCKKIISNSEVSMGMGVPGVGPIHYCYDCAPLPDDKNEEDPYGFSGDWWKGDLK